MSTATASPALPRIHPGTSMGTVRLRVADLGRSRAFYERVIGLRATEQEDGSLAFGVSGEHPLVELVGDASAPALDPRATGLYHLAILMPSRRDLAFALARLGLGRWPLDGASDHLVSEALYLSDPDGNGLELYRDRPRSAWPWRNGKLEASEPSIQLNFESLLSELDGIAPTSDTWRGLPSFTRIGHVHLQVADLAQSVAFYQGILGLEESITGMDGACFFAAEGYHHHIACNVWTGPGAQTPPHNALGLRFFTLVLPAWAEVLLCTSRAQAAGLPVIQHEQMCLLHDPAGNGVLLTSESLQYSEEVMALASIFG